MQAEPQQCCYQRSKALAHAVQPSSRLGAKLLSTHVFADACGVQPRTSSSAVVVFPAPGGPWMRVSRLSGHESASTHI